MSKGGMSKSHCDSNNPHEPGCKYAKGGDVDSMKLDLKHFKKIGDTKLHTALQHKDGHVLHIAHKGCSPEEVKRLKALPMAKGGKVPPSSAPQKLYLPGSDQDRKKVQDSFNSAMSEGGEVKRPNLPEGDPDAGAEQKQAIADIHRKEASHEDTLNYLKEQYPQKKGYGGSVGYAEGGSVADQLAKADKGSVEPSAPQDSQPQAPVTEQLQPESQPEQQPQQSPFLAPAQAQQQATEQGAQRVISGTEQAAAEQGKLGKEQAAVEGRAQESLKKNQQEFEQHFNELSNHVNAAVQDVRDQHIDPNRFLNNMSTGQRITTGIGMLIAGLGGNRPENNPVIQFLNKQIDNDIDAQKTELGKKENLVGAYMKQFGNLEVATNMARATLNSTIASSLQQKADLAKSPIEKQNALAAVGKFQMDSAAALNQAARMSVAFKQVGQQEGGNPSLQVEALVPKEEQKEAYKELGEQQNINQANKAALESFDKIAKLQTVSNRLGSPIQSRKQIGAEWGPTIEKLTKTQSGRTTPMNVDLFASLEPKVTDSSETVALKRKRFVDLIEQGRSTPVLDSRGIKANQLPSQVNKQSSPEDQQAIQWAKANPQDPRSKQILKANGI